MGSCELGSASPPMTVVGGAKGLVGEAGIVQLSSESNCCLDMGDRLGTLGDGDGKGVDEFSGLARAELETESTVEGTVLEDSLANGVEPAVLEDCSGEKLEELVVEPLSSLDISSQTPVGGVEPAVPSPPEKDFSLGVDHSLCTMETNLMHMSPNIASAQRPSEKTTQIPDLIRGSSNSDIVLENVSSIECGLSSICIDSTQCQGERDSHATNFMGEDPVASDSHVTGACGGYTVLHVPDNKSIGEHSFDKSLVVVSDIHAGPMVDGSDKSLMMPDTLRQVVGATVNNGHFVESSNHEDKDGLGNVMTDGDMSELYCLDTPLALRRSSRSRKTVQKAQKGKNVVKSLKKDGKISLGETIDLLSETTRKKRSGLRRSICTSGWGMSGNLSKYFERSVEVTANQVLVVKKRERKSGQRSRKRNTVQVVTSSQLSEEKQEVPCRPIRLKVTFGRKEEQHKMEGTPPIGGDILEGVLPANDEHERYIERVGGRMVDDPVLKEMPMSMHCSSSIANVQLRGTHLDACSVSGKSSLSDSSQLGSEKFGSSCVGKFLDPGTSPDSEVIDQVLESSVGQSKNNMSGSIYSFKTLVSPASSKSSKSRRNKKDKLCQTGISGMESEGSPVNAEESREDGKLKKTLDGHCTDDTICHTNAPSEIPLSNTSSSELVSVELPSVAEKALGVDNSVDSNISSRMIGNETAESGNSSVLLLPAEGKKNSKISKAKGKSVNKPRVMNAKRNPKEPSGQRKGSKKKLASHGKAGMTGILDNEHQDMSLLGTGNQEVFHVAEADPMRTLLPQGPSCVPLPPIGLGEQTLPPRVAWVCCDDCGKWRCIPAELADMIEETNRKWTCKDNQDHAFADCSIPQEKSNAAINAELQISDEEDGGRLGSKNSGIKASGDPLHATWMLVRSNLFLHRSRKTQTMDEIMVCHCKPPVDGNPGCGSQCLNRMLNIECVQGTCPCGDLCSNQSFQRCQYANLSWFRSGRKGYGLQVLEDISEGQFLIEYVGEVLDLQSYEARQKEYASKGHKHFYFMTLNGNEVIDACAKGNLGRFVNHSCDPNCRTEKWVVNGEICVGLFALRKIRKGEELTFDYNYVRVFGAAAKKCYCGSLKCRGYIGGDPHNAEVIVHGDSDEEFPEPVVVDENGKIDHSLDNVIVRSSAQDVQDIIKGDKVCEVNHEAVLEVNESVARIVESFVRITEKETVDEVCESSDGLSTAVVDNDKTEPLHEVLQLKCTPDNFTGTSASPKSDVLLVNRINNKGLAAPSDFSVKTSDVDMEGEQPPSKPRSRMKISRPSKSVKNRKSHSNTTSAEKSVLTTQSHKSDVSPYKPKKLLDGSANGHSEVELKLNELLDSDGGICKKKDASRGYLKLLLLTAASGDSGNGGAIQSNRELSMILDAILKTRSRGVLLDIISKNGLQMLHNMMKLYRRDFKKTPILRKLLKVLEFLAEKEILSVERIVVDPLRPGVESFKESIFLLAEHEDKKVHLTARNFRDKWIPRHVRKYYVMDISDQDREFSRGSNSSRPFGVYHHEREHGVRMPESVECMKQAASNSNPGDTSMQKAGASADFLAILTRPRKRKSRWDQPADPSKQSKEQKIEPCSPHINASPVAVACDGGDKSAVESRQEETDQRGTDDVMQDSEDDAPPGFSCPRTSDDAPPGFSSPVPVHNSCAVESQAMTSVGLLQERFNPRLSVAYGIPCSALQQLGTVEVGTVDSWAVAPAIPFQPFPPLPPYPRDKRPRLHHCHDNGMLTNRSWEDLNQNNNLHNDTHRGSGMPSTSGAYLPPLPNSGGANKNVLHNGRGSWNKPGRRNYKQKKYRPPWLRNYNGRGFKGHHHPRNRDFDRGMETLGNNEHNDQRLADVYHSIECAGNSY